MKMTRNIQYWCINGKCRIYVARLRNEEKTSFSESFHHFHAVNTPILYLSCNSICKKMLFTLIIKTR